MTKGIRYILFICFFTFCPLSLSETREALQARFTGQILVGVELELTEQILGGLAKFIDFDHIQDMEGSHFRPSRFSIRAFEDYVDTLNDLDDGRLLKDIRERLTQGLDLSRPEIVQSPRPSLIVPGNVEVQQSRILPSQPAVPNPPAPGSILGPNGEPLSQNTPGLITSNPASNAADRLQRNLEIIRERWRAFLRSLESLSPEERAKELNRNIRIRYLSENEKIKILSRIVITAIGKGTPPGIRLRPDLTSEEQRIFENVQIGRDVLGGGIIELRHLTPFSDPQRYAESLASLYRALRLPRSSDPMSLFYSQHSHITFQDPQIVANFPTELVTARLFLQVVNDGWVTHDLDMFRNNKGYEFRHHSGDPVEEFWEYLRVGALASESRERAEEHVLNGIRRLINPTNIGRMYEAGYNPMDLLRRFPSPFRAEITAKVVDEYFFLLQNSGPETERLVNELLFFLRAIPSWEQRHNGRSAASILRLFESRNPNHERAAMGIVNLGENWLLPPLSALSDSTRNRSFLYLLGTSLGTDRRANELVRKIFLTGTENQKRDLAAALTRSIKHSFPLLRPQLHSPPVVEGILQTAGAYDHIPSSLSSLLVEIAAIHPRSELGTRALNRAMQYPNFDDETRRRLLSQSLPLEIRRRFTLFENTQAIQDVQGVLQFWRAARSAQRDAYDLSTIAKEIFRHALFPSLPLHVRLQIIEAVTQTNGGMTGLLSFRMDILQRVEKAFQEMKNHTELFRRYGPMARTLGENLTSLTRNTSQPAPYRAKSYLLLRSLENALPIPPAELTQVREWIATDLSALLHTENGLEPAELLIRLTNEAPSAHLAHRISELIQPDPARLSNFDRPLVHYLLRTAPFTPSTLKAMAELYGRPSWSSVIREFYRNHANELLSRSWHTGSSATLLWAMLRDDPSITLSPNCSNCSYNTIRDIRSFLNLSPAPEFPVSLLPREFQRSLAKLLGNALTKIQVVDKIVGFLLYSQIYHSQPEGLTPPSEILEKLPTLYWERPFITLGEILGSGDSFSTEGSQLLLERLLREGLGRNRNIAQQVFTYDALTRFSANAARHSSSARAFATFLGHHFLSFNNMEQEKLLDILTRFGQVDPETLTNIARRMEQPEAPPHSLMLELYRFARNHSELERVIDTRNPNAETCFAILRRFGPL